MESAQSNLAAPRYTSNSSPPARVVALQATLKHWRDHDATRFPRLAVLIGDAVREGDEVTLVAAQRGLRRVYARELAGGAAEKLEQRGRILALLDLVDWSLQRLTPHASVERVRRGAPDRRFLELLAEEGQLLGREIADLLSMDEDQVGEIGRQLQSAGVVRMRRMDNGEVWDITPRGRDTLLIRLNVQLDSGGVRRVAQDILEPARYDKGYRRQRSATASVVATLLSADRPLSFEELADRTDQRPPLLRLGVNALLDRGILERANSSEGVTVTIPRGRFCAIGIEIKPGVASGVVIGLRGERLRVGSQRLQDMRPEVVADAVAQLVARLRQPDPAQPRLPSHLLGIGIELGGHVDGMSGMVALSPNVCVDGRPWRDVPFRTLVRERVDGATVIVENDANALAIHQQLFGSLGDERVDFAVIIVGDGVGAGIVAGGELLHGANGMAGEIGHLIIHPGGRTCGCGKNGCLEAYAAVPQILAASAAPGAEDRPRSLKEAADRAEAGDAECRRAFLDAGDAIGRGVAALKNIVGPREVVIAVPEPLALGRNGGGVPGSAYRLFDEALRARTLDHAFPSAESAIKIRQVADIAEYGAQGAAAILLRRFVEIPLHAVAVDTTPTNESRGGQSVASDPGGLKQITDMPTMVGPKTELLEGLNEALTGVMA